MKQNLPYQLLKFLNTHKTKPGYVFLMSWPGLSQNQSKRRKVMNKKATKILHSSLIHKRKEENLQQKKANKRNLSWDLHKKITIWEGRIHHMKKSSQLKLFVSLLEQQRLTSKLTLFVQA